MMGAAPRTIQEFAGHAGPKTTLKYMHMAEGGDRPRDHILERRDEHIESTTRQGGQDDHEHPASKRRPRLNRPPGSTRT
jgi:hypothetical protein